MVLNRYPRPRGALLVLAILSSVPGARAEDLSARFTLLRYIPGDSWMAINFRSNPEAAWISARWEGVFEDVRKTGLDRDALALIVDLVEEDSKEQVRQTMDALWALVSGIQWSEMLAQEVAVGERLIDRLPGYEYIVLARGSSGSGDRNYPALVALARGLAALSPNLKLSDLAEAGAEGVRLDWLVDPADAEKVELSFSLLRRGDVIGVIIGHRATADVLALFAGRPNGPKSVIDSERFQRIFADASSAEDGVMMFDIQGLLGQIKVLFGAAIKESSKPDAKQWAGVAYRVIDELALVDYVVNSVETHGRRQVTRSVIRLHEERRTSELARAAFDRAPVVSFERYVPADATSFWVSNGANFGGIYDWVLKFLAEECPDGQAHVERWKGFLASVGFDPHADVFNWLGGEFAQISLPSVTAKAKLDSDALLFVGVRDADLARAKVNQALDQLAKFMQANGQPLMILPAPGVEAEGFRQINHPMMMGFAQPVVGVTDRWLVLGTSAAAVNKSLAVAAGRAPSIQGTTRYREEGLPEEGPVQSLSFTDRRNYGEELADGMQTLATVGSMLPMMMPLMAKDPKDAAEIAKIAEVIQKVLAMCSKLAPVFRKVDFLSSEAAVTTMEGNVIRETRIVTYRDQGADVVRSDN